MALRSSAAKNGSRAVRLRRRHRTGVGPVSFFPLPLKCPRGTLGYIVAPRARLDVAVYVVALRSPVRRVSERPRGHGDFGWFNSLLRRLYRILAKRGHIALGVAKYIASSRSEDISRSAQAEHQSLNIYRRAKASIKLIKSRRRLFSFILCRCY